MEKLNIPANRSEPVERLPL